MKAIVRKYNSLLFMLPCISAILGKSSYLLYYLVSAMQPRMLVTFGVDLKPMPVSVRVGQVWNVFEISYYGDLGPLRVRLFNCASYLRASRGNHLRNSNSQQRFKTTGRGITATRTRTGSKTPSCLMGNRKSSEKCFKNVSKWI